LKKVIVSVINDLTTDQRVDKICSSLHNLGFDVLLVGRKYNDSLPIHRKYKTHRMAIFLRKGVFSYVEFFIRLFFFLVFHKKDILLSNDLDTLLPNFLVSKLQSKKIVYDSHELFLELPELINRPKKRFIWQKIESYILPKLKNTYTVCQSIADYYNSKYKTDFKVVRNIPQSSVFSLQSSVGSFQSLTGNSKFKIQNSKFLIIYQGAINIGRGLELMIDTMQYLDDCQFIIIGDGEITSEIKNLILEKKLSSKIFMLGKKTPSELKKITPYANLGLSIEEDLGLNYRYALPNKLFDYIHANVPVLVSDLPEMKRIVLDHQVGEIIKNRAPKLLAQQITNILKQDQTTLQKNLKTAALDLQWENEEKVLREVFEDFI